LDADQPSICTQLHTTWPAIVEIVGHTGLFDYVQFCAVYGPFDLYALDNFCRAAELTNMSAMIKIDQEPRTYLAQRGIGAGFQSVMFADCRTVEDARECVRAVRPDTPEDGGTFGSAARRFTYPAYGGSADYVQALRDVVVALMIEKKGAVEQLEEILSLEGVDMINWGPADYALNVGRPGDWFEPDIKALERKILETALKMGVAPRAEIRGPEQAKYYLDLGVKHFSISADVLILHSWLSENGEALRKVVGRAM
jgi:4-hydroxy-2-oxoheptanedioate aldolase